MRKKWSKEAKERLKRNGENNPNWKGGKKYVDGYVYCHSPNHPNATKNVPYVLRSRLTMEEHLGRYLEIYEDIHHKNGIKDDDRLENLEVLLHKDHGKHHSHEYWRKHEVS